MSMRYVRVANPVAPMWFVGPIPDLVPVLVWLLIARQNRGCVEIVAAGSASFQELSRREWFRCPLAAVETWLVLALGQQEATSIESLAWQVATRAVRGGTFLLTHDWPLLLRGGLWCRFEVAGF